MKTGTHCSIKYGMGCSNVLLPTRKKRKSTNAPKAYAADPEVDKYATHTLPKINKFMSIVLNQLVLFVIVRIRIGWRCTIAEIF